MPRGFREQPETETSSRPFLDFEEAFHNAMDALKAAGMREDDAGPHLVALARGADRDALLGAVAAEHRAMVMLKLSTLIDAAQRLKSGKPDAP